MMIDPRMVRLTRGVRWRIAGQVGLGLAVVATGVTQGLVTARILTRIFNGEDFASVSTLLIIVVVLIGIIAGLQWLRSVGAKWVAGGVKLTLRNRLYQRLLDLGPGYLMRTQTGKVQSTLVDGVEALEGYLSLYIPQAVVALVGPSLILIYFMTIDPIIGVVVLVAILAGLFGAQAFKGLLGEFGERHWNAYRDLNAEFLDSMQGLPTLKAFNAGRRRGEYLHSQGQRLYEATMAQMSISLLGTGITNLAMATGTGLAVGIGALQLSRGAITSTELFVILFLTAYCFLPLTELNRYWHQGYLGLSALAGVTELLESEPDVIIAPHARPLPVGEIEPSFAFEHVTFGYNNGERLALSNLTFSVEPAERVAIVGRSGSGKTTVVSLLLRFFDPQEGRILLGGIDLREYDLATARAMLAIVSQDTYLFHGTVADNLRMAKPHASQAELEEAAQHANAHEFISRLEYGYDTLLGERGLNLSGGQRQRIAIARALLKNAPILVLDEATASVDAASEAAIQEALDHLTANRTTLMIAHRLSTVVHADRILVLQEGDIVETGRHGELLTQQGAYARLVAAQRGVA